MIGVLFFALSGDVISPREITGGGEPPPYIGVPYCCCLFLRP
jgi:hypothetical protein